MLLEERTRTQNIGKKSGTLQGKSYFSEVENKNFCNLIDFIKDKENTRMPCQCYFNVKEHLFILRFHQHTGF